MRYYKGDTIATIVIYLDADGLVRDMCRSDKNGPADRSSFTGEPLPPVGPAVVFKSPGRAVVRKLVARPVKNHLRAAWDSIFQP